MAASQSSSSSSSPSRLALATDVFPQELYRMISGDLEMIDLLSLRTANKNLHRLITPHAFRVIHLGNSATTAHAFEILQQSGSVAKYVEEVNFCEGLVDSSHQAHRSDDQGPATRKALARAFSGLHKLPSLKTLQLTFYPYFTEESHQEFPIEPSQYLLLQLALLEAIAENPTLKSLKTLSLTNILAFPLPIFESDAFHQLVGRLASISISGLSAKCEGSYFQSPICDFWSSIVPTRLLAPSASQLTSLSLHSDQGILLFDFQAVSFPRLTSLTLSQMIFRNADGEVPGNSAEDFIIAHKSTLHTLELDACPMFIDEEEKSIRLWSSVWQYFEDELDHLLELTVRRCRGRDIQLGPDRRDLRMGYVYEEPGSGYYFHRDDIEGEGYDNVALERFLDVVELRKHDLQFARTPQTIRDIRQ